MLINAVPCWVRTTIVAALCTISGLSAAQFHLRTAPAELNPNSSGETERDAQARVAADGNGNWVVLWVYAGLEPDYLRGIAVSRSSDNGATWSAPTALDPTPLMGRPVQTTPEIVTDGNGVWIATWSEDLFFPTLRQIYVARSVDNGASWSEPLALGPTEGNSSFDISSPATDGAGNWIVVWARENVLQPGSTGDILYSRSSDNGATWTNFAYLSPEDDGVDDSSPRIATDSAGRWITVWTTSNLDNLNVDSSISTDNGATWTSPTTLVGASDPITVGNSSPDIAFGTGYWLLVWTSFDVTQSIDPDLHISRSDDGGATWTSPALMIAADAADAADSFDGFPRLTTDGVGNWMVGWWEGDNTQNQEFDRNFMARSSDNGATWTPAVRLLPNVDHVEWADHAPCIATDRTGNWLVVWEARHVSSGGSDFDLLFSRWTGILAPDRDGDNLSDADETLYGSNSDAYDTDGDTLDDADEVNIHNTHPTLADTDGDGVRDDIEISLGTDPNDPFDFPLLPLSWMPLVGVVLGLSILVFLNRLVYRNHRQTRSHLR